jgi:rare lipoprotein A (peptidoglycan hydrolase)
LSYAAAHELDMVRDGTALVEVRSLSGNALAPESVASRETASPAREMFVQAGAFTDRTNADRQSLWLNQYNLGKVQIRTVERADGRVVHRVWLGPVPDVAGFDAMVAKLQELGIRDAHLAVAP